jgi:ADP-ribose pyrophosphatase YjhB (NUDIX family)
LAKTLVTRVLQRYWRFSRGLTLGAEGCVIDRQGRVLLLRHTERPGWHLPGGGVEKNETVARALVRELREGAGIVVEKAPQLVGIYANFESFPGDHIALFVVRSWRQPAVPTPNGEIAGQAFFAPSRLPQGIHSSAEARIREVLDGRPRSLAW